MKKVIVALACLLLQVSAFAAPPAEDPDVKMGRESHEAMLASGIKLLSDPVLQGRIEKITTKMVAIVNSEVIPATFGRDNKVKFNYKFFVVDDNDINAFSLPGGYIYINKGLISYAQSDDELAGVLGHEIIHAAHHHVAKLQKEQERLNTQMALGALAAILARVPMSDTGNLMQGFQLVALQKVSGHSQNAERDADRGGIELVIRAGYNPVGMLTFMERLARDRRARPDIEQGIFRTHPPEKERAEAMIALFKAQGRVINRRETTQMLRVSLREVVGNPSVTEVVLDGRVYFRTPNAARAKEAAAALDAALNVPLQLYDIARRGTSVTIRNTSILTVESGDALGAGQGVTPEALAESACKAVRSALYRYVLEGVY